LGNLFKYNSDLDQNILVAHECFFCIDQIEGENEELAYFINLVDQPQKTSYTHLVVEKTFNFSLSESDHIFMWVGLTKDDGIVPAWSFVFSNPGDIQNFRGVLTKVVYETNLQT